jgi:hypothetical protein
VVDKTTRNELVFSETPGFQLFVNGMTLGPTIQGYEASYSSDAGYLRYNNPAVAEAFSQANAAATLEDAQVYYDEIQKLMTDDMAAVWRWSIKRGWGSNNYLNTEDCGMSGLYAGWIAIGKAYFEK